MAKKRRPAVDLLVYFLVRCVVCLVQMMTFEQGYTVAAALARLAYALDKRHRNVAMENLRIAFGDRYTPRQREQMVLGVYEHFLRMVIEMALIPRKVHVWNWKKYARLENFQVITETLLVRQPTIILTAHFGNWEMAGFLLAALGVRSHAIARDLDNPYLHRFLLRFREWTGQTILSKNGDFERIDKVLADKGVLVSLADQSAGERGMFVDFFGRPASTHKAIALLAMEHQAKILVSYAYRDREGCHYRVCSGRRLDPADYADRPDCLQALTQDFTREVESAIRLAPEQYLWLHNRWKHQPPVRKPRVKKAAA